MISCDRDKILKVLRLRRIENSLCNFYCVECDPLTVPHNLFIVLWCSQNPSKFQFETRIYFGNASPIVAKCLRHRCMVGSILLDYISQGKSLSMLCFCTCNWNYTKYHIQCHGFYLSLLNTNCKQLMYCLHHQM